MKRADVEAVVRRVYVQPQFAHYRLDNGVFDVYFEELKDVAVPIEMLWDAVRSLLYEDDQRLPTPQAMRRCAFRAMGLLAPSWAEAQREVRRYLDDPSPAPPPLPGPVRRALMDRGGEQSARDPDNEAAYWAQLRDAYAERAREHDRLLLGPGGLETFIDVCVWWNAVRERAALNRVVGDAVMVLAERGQPLLSPHPDAPLPVLRELVARAEAKLGYPLDEIDDHGTQRDLAELFKPPRQLGSG